MYNSGKRDRRRRIAWTTGPAGSSAEVPKASLAAGCKGTPNRITDRSPLRTSGFKKGIKRFNPRRCWLGSDGMGVSSSGLSVMKRGYISDS